MIGAMFNHVLNQKRGSLRRAVRSIFQNGRRMFCFFSIRRIAEDSVDVLLEFFESEICQFHAYAVTFLSDGPSVGWLIHADWKDDDGFSVINSFD